MISDISKSLSDVCNLFFFFYGHFYGPLLVAIITFEIVIQIEMIQNPIITHAGINYVKLIFLNVLFPNVFLLESNDCLLPNDRSKATDFLKKDLKGLFSFLFQSKT